MPGIKTVLFLCTGNSARSQMAEGLMRALAPGQWTVASAGVLPSQVHPVAVRVMDELGIDISRQTSKSIDRFLGQSFDYIITLCDHAAVACPAFPGEGKRIHWSLEDPASANGTTEERLAVFRRARDEIKRRIEKLLKAELC
jgi:arsenate reductase (thioredoxin)